MQEVLDWFKAKDLEAYSISYGPSLLYNTMFPKHKERLSTKLSEVVKTVAKIDFPETRKHFDIVVACEDDDGNDIDVPLLSIQFRK
jgi:ubiquitin-activating enzyme E1